MKKKLMLGAAFGALAAANPLMAADLAVKAPIHKAAAAVPVYNWTGCYVGGNVGYGWGRSKGDIDIPNLSALGPPLPTLYSISSDPQGAVGGVQIGDKWVLGFEADIQASGQRANRTFSTFKYRWRGDHRKG